MRSTPAPTNQDRSPVLHHHAPRPEGCHLQPMRDWGQALCSVDVNSHLQKGIPKGFSLQAAHAGASPCHSFYPGATAGAVPKDSIVITKQLGEHLRWWVFGEGSGGGGGKVVKVVEEF